MNAESMAPLTDRQVKVLRLIRDHIAAYGRPPTIRWLLEATGVNSPNGVMCHLHALVKKGYLKRDGETANGMYLVGMTLVLEYEEGPAGERLREALEGDK